MHKKLETKLSKPSEKLGIFLFSNEFYDFLLYTVPQYIKYGNDGQSHSPSMVSAGGGSMVIN